jgi:hypothetical protein
MPVPRPLSLGVVLCPDVAAPELSFPRGAWLCAEAIPLDTSNAVAANIAEYFFMSYSFSVPGYAPANVGRRQAFRKSGLDITSRIIRPCDGALRHDGEKRASNLRADNTMFVALGLSLPLQSVPSIVSR